MLKGNFSHWLALSLYPIAIYFDPQKIFENWSRECIFLQRTFKSIFKDFFKLLLISGVQIESPKTIIIKLNEIWRNILAPIIIPIFHYHPPKSCYGIRENDYESSITFRKILTPLYVEPLLILGFLSLSSCSIIHRK